jgi:chromosome segregation ATPase
LIYPDKQRSKMVWTMWQGWKDEETKRIAVERQYAFLEKTLKHVLQQRNELERDRDELKNERDELKKQLECRVDHRVEGRQGREVNKCSHCGRLGHLDKKCFFINKHKTPGDQFYRYSKEELDEAFANANKCKSRR